MKKATNFKHAMLVSALSLALGVTVAHAAGDTGDTAKTDTNTQGSMTGKQKG